jgi:hypothetical protein
LTQDFPFTPLHRALMHNYGYHPRWVTEDAHHPVIHVVDSHDALAAIITRSGDDSGWSIDVTGRAGVVVPLDMPGWTIADVIVEAYEGRD